MAKSRFDIKRLNDLLNATPTVRKHVAKSNGSPACFRFHIVNSLDSSNDFGVNNKTELFNVIIVGCTPEIFEGTRVKIHISDLPSTWFEREIVILGLW